MKIRYSMTLNLISPCGGSYDDVMITVKSVLAVSSQLDNILFKHYLCYNNNLKPYNSPLSDRNNYEVIELDINPIQSRSFARNQCLAQLKGSNNSFVMFLDAGDLLEMDALAEILEKVRLPVSDNLLFACYANIQGEKIVGTRKPKPNLKYFINPFYLGSVIMPDQLAIQAFFQEGKKEDWKYWIDILEKEPEIILVDAPNYTYKINNKKEHFYKKIRLIIKQYLFFRNYLNMSVIKATFYCLIHYIIVFWFWTITINNKKSN